MFGKSLRILIAAVALVSVALSAPVQDYAMVDSDGFSFESQLVDAANQNNFSIVKLLLQQGSSPDEKGRFETTALQRAAYNGFGNITDLLIAGGANINAKDFGGATALHMAARQGNEEVVNKLVKAGASIDIKDNEGYTPLHRAVASGNYQVARVLLSARANPNSSSSGGDTPLVDAVRSGDAKLVSLLNSYGADKSGTNSSGKSAVDYAIASGNRNVSEALSARNEPVYDNQNVSNIQAGPALSSAQNRRVPVAPVEEITDPLIGVQTNTPAFIAADTNIENTYNTNDTGNIDVPAVVLPNSERAKMIAEGKSPMPVALNENYGDVETSYQQPKPAPQSGFDQLFTDTVQRNEQVVEQTEVAVSTKGTRLSGSEYELKPSEQFPSEPKSMQYASSRVDVEAGNDVPVYNDELNQQQVNPTEELTIEPTDIRENADFTDYTSAAHTPINFVPERMPAPLQSEELADGTPASFRYKNNGWSYRGELQPNVTNVASAYPEFNYQNYQSEELFTTPVQGLQVINLATKEINNKRVEPAINYAQNINSDYSQPAIAESRPLPASMNVSGYSATNAPVQVSDVRDNIMSSNSYPDDDMSVPASMTHAYKNIGKMPRVARPYQQPQVNYARNIQPYRQEVMQAVPVPEVEIGSGEIVDAAANHIISQPASSATQLPPEYENVPRQNNLQPDSLVSSIQSFYNEGKGYRQQPTNVEELTRRPANSYQPSAPASSYISSQVPVVQRNVANGPKSLQLWNNVSASKRDQLYNKITQHNAPVYTEPKPVKSYAEEKSYEPVSEDISVSFEPAADNGVIESENAKVPEVAVLEENIETINSEVPAEPAIETAKAMPENIVPEPTIPDSSAPDPVATATEAAVTPSQQPTIPSEPAVPEAPALAENNSTVDVPEMPSFDAPVVPYEPYHAQPSEPQPVVPQEVAINEAPVEPSPSAQPEVPANTLSEDVVDYTAASDDVDLTGTHSIIGGFDTIEKATDYFNGISLRLGLLYNYKIVQSKETGKFYIAVGKLQDSDSANKVCEVYKSDEVTCEVYMNLSYGSKKLSDLAMIESKKVYAMIGEFQTADQADAFFKQFSAKYKVEYKIAQNPDNNLYLLQIGPVFNGGDGKKICDDMKTPETPDIKCRVALK